MLSYAPDDDDDDDLSVRDQEFEIRILNLMIRTGGCSGAHDHFHQERSVSPRDRGEGEKGGTGALLVSVPRVGRCGQVWA